MDRPRDLVFDALVEVTGATIASERGTLNVARQGIKEQMPDADDDEIANEIRYRAGVYREMWPSMALTPTALLKHWERIPLEAPKPAPIPNSIMQREDCPMCGGDKMVVFRTRPAPDGIKGHDHVYEEMAACPECSSGVSVGYWRADGSRFNPPDPSVVRRRVTS